MGHQPGNGDPRVFSRARSLLGPVLVGATVAAVLGAFVLMPADGLWTNDNGCKFLQLQGILASRFRSFSIPYPGRAFDPGLEFVPLRPPFGVVVGGELHAPFSPFFPMVSALPYALMGYRGLLLLPALGCLLTLPALWRLAGLLPGAEVKRPLAVFIGILCTPMWFYGATFWEHVPAACLVLWAVWGAVSYRERRRRRHLLSSAVLSGLAVYFRDDLYVMVPVLAAVVTLARPPRWRDGLVYLAAFTAAATPLWVFQAFALGNPLGFHVTGFSLFGEGLVGYLIGRARVFGLMFGSHGNAWLSVATTFPFLLLFVTFPRIERRKFGGAVVLAGLVALAAGVCQAAGHLTAASPIRWLYQANGLFAVSPILMLAFLRTAESDEAASGVERGAGERTKVVLWQIGLAYTAAYLLLSPAASGGIHWGNRYLLPLYPIMAAMAASTLGQWAEAPSPPRRPGMAVLALVCALSVGFQTYSMWLLREGKEFSSRMNRAVRERPEQVVIALGWYVPQELALVYDEKKMFLLGEGQRPGALLERLRSAGVESVLRVTGRPNDAPDRNGVVFDDALNFISLKLESVRIGGPARARAGGP